MIHKEILYIEREMIYHINEGTKSLKNNIKLSEVIVMFFKKKEKSTYNDVVAKIRGEIIQSLRKKGVSFSDIDVDFRQENVSLKLSINEK